ncbi:MAG: arylsulfatase [Candidatus Brevundimonas phytovorans]|nr:arylsulfatase [Brevundimonas sp.]WEK58563.1 MAG: arylsulfatase [Brevundimonas sp.]
MKIAKRLLPALLGGVSLLSLSPVALQAQTPSAPAPLTAPTPQRDARPNIVLIVADDMGFSDLSAFGSEIATPNLDALVASGVQLTNFHASPACSPTRAMLMSGVDNHIAGLGTMAEVIAPEQVGVPGYEGALNDRVVPFPRLLQDAGYHTFMVGKWHLGKEEGQSPQARGFDHSFVLLNGGADHFTQGGTIFAAPKASYRDDGALVDLPANFFSTDYYTDRILQNIDSVKDDKPFFAYIAYTAPHWPLQAPDAYLDRYRGVYDVGYDVILDQRIERMKARGVIAQDVTPAPAPGVWPAWNALSAEDKAKEARRMEVYAAMIANMDDNVGRLVAELKRTGEYDNTVFVFFSDNGAEGSDAEDISEKNREWIQATFDNSLDNMGRRNSFIGYGPNWARVSSAPFRLFKAFTYEGGTRTPAFVAGPGVRRSLSDAYVGVKDWAPTFLQLAQTRHPAEDGAAVPPLQGRSAVPFLMGQTDQVHPDDATQCLELFGRVAVRIGDFKLTYSNAPWGSGDWELYNTRRDPTEATDLSQAEPQQLATMKAAWEGCQRDNNILWTPEIAGKNAYGNTSVHFPDHQIDFRTKE